jgi:hypothetical protein
MISARATGGTVGLGGRSGPADICGQFNHWNRHAGALSTRKSMGGKLIR